jgi:hypothetical protein
MSRKTAPRLVAVSVALLLSALLVVPATGDTPPAAAPPKTPPLLFAPPLFASSGEAQAVSALVTGQPDAVRLVVGDRSFDMREDGDSIFTGTIPSELVTAELSYSVSAAYASVTNTSEPARLVVLDEVRTSTPDVVGDDGVPVVTLGIGSRADQLGASTETDGARQLPAAFVTDRSGSNLRILDTMKSRIVDATKDGIGSATKLGSGSTTATDVVHGRKDSLLVLDQARDEIVDVSSKGQRTLGSVGARKHDRGARLAFDGASDTIFVRDATQGRFVPVTKSGRRTTSKERSAGAADGLPTAHGALGAEVSGDSVLFGLSSGDPIGYRITFAEPVLDATEVVVDAAGLIWGLVGVARGEAAAMYLVSIHPDSGRSTAREVPVSLPGDVTRRLTAAEDGVVLMNGTERSISFVRFTEGAGR